jgi:hypothetical protein
LIILESAVDASADVPNEVNDAGPSEVLDGLQNDAELCDNPVLDKDELIADVKRDFCDLVDLAKSDISPALLLKLHMALRKPKTPTAATAAAVAISQSMGNICGQRRRGYIGVNTTGRSRRRLGVSKGAKKVPMGRPCKVEKQKRNNPKVPRVISQAVNCNRANAKSH